MASEAKAAQTFVPVAEGAITLPYLIEAQHQQEDELHSNHSHTKSKSGKLTLLPLIFLIYFEVSGGPYAEEPVVAAAGPLLAILGFVLFPLIWCIPEALVTAELATTFPGNGGYVIWADRAFGPFWGSLLGYWKFLSVAINNGAYLVLCADYLKRVLPMVFSGGRSRDLAILAFNVVLTFLNYTGLTIVGYSAVALGVVSLLPFLIMFFISIPRINPERWAKFGAKASEKDWKLYFTTLFWNLNFWDNASTLAGEVDRPEKTFPLALLLSGIIISIGYIVPLLAGTGALDIEYSRWTDGFLADAAGMIAGDWLKMWVEVGAVLSTVGLFEAQLSSGSYQLLGTAELGFLPRFFAARSSWFGTPWVGILASSAVTLGVSYMSFGEIISSANCLYSLGMLLEFSSFIWLRQKYPSLNRPFRVGLGVPSLVCMMIVPTGFLFYVVAIAGKLAYAVSGGLTAVGVAGYFFLGWCKARGWVEFENQPAGEEVVVVPVEGEA